MAGTASRGRAAMPVRALRNLAFALMCLAMLLSVAPMAPALAQESGMAGGDAGMEVQHGGEAEAGAGWTMEWVTGAIILGGAFAVGAFATESWAGGVVSAAAAAGIYALMP